MNAIDVLKTIQKKNSVNKWRSRMQIFRVAKAERAN